MSNLICKLCMSYMTIHPENFNYRKCITCGYCEDKDGYNKLNPKPIEKESKGCSCGAGTGEKTTCSCNNT